MFAIIKYTPSAEASQPSQVSQKVSNQHGLVTVVTDVTRENTPHGEYGNKPSSSWLSARRTIGGGRMACGSAGAVIPNPRKRKCSGWTDTWVGDPLSSIGTSVIEPCVQGYQKSYRLIGSIDSIV